MEGCLERCVDWGVERRGKRRRDKCEEAAHQVAEAAPQEQARYLAAPQSRSRSREYAQEPMGRCHARSPRQARIFKLMRRLVEAAPRHARRRGVRAARIDTDPADWRQSLTAFATLEGTHHVQFSKSHQDAGAACQEKHTLHSHTRRNQARITHTRIKPQKLTEKNQTRVKRIRNEHIRTDRCSL